MLIVSPIQFGFSGISTFAHLKHFKCLTTPYDFFDIAVIGAPFDTAVTYRPGTFTFIGLLALRRHESTTTHGHLLHRVPPDLSLDLSLS